MSDDQPRAVTGMSPGDVAHGAQSAGRAIGAMFLFIFGGAWLEAGALLPPGSQAVTLGAIAVVTVTLFLATYGFCYRPQKFARVAASTAPERVRAGRTFNIINVTQWVLIATSSIVLSRLGRPAWIPPAIMLIVALHFLPLARIFGQPAYYVTSAALVVIAVVYPLVMSRGPASPAGCYGAGLVLWASGSWAVTERHRRLLWGKETSVYGDAAYIGADKRAPQKRFTRLIHCREASQGQSAS